MPNIIKKTFYKFFDKEKYFSFKSKEKVNESYKRFKNITEKQIKNIREKIDGKSELTFLHFGHCGDIVCSLAAIKELSKSHKCNLYIEINKKIPLPYYKHPAGNVYIDERIFKMLIPLLKHQKYLNKVNKYENQEIDIDLNIFREMPINLNFSSPRWFFHVTGVQTDLSQAYLEAEDHNDLRDKIIIHRTFRYRNNFINYKFLNNFKDLYFIGLKNEYEDLKKQVNNLKFYECKNYLDMANIIKSSKFFLGNSSIAFPIAEALKVPRLLEASPNFPIMQPIGKEAFDFYYQPHFEKLFNYLNEKYTH